VALSLSIVILSYNRCDALRRTLGELRLQGLLESAQVIVADNASKDSSARMVQEEFPSVLWVKQASNLGVETFNLGAERAGRDLLLLLDDDSWPDAKALPPAMSLMEQRPDIGGVALLPRHPGTGVEEWRHDNEPRGRWMMMGCGNLVRRDAWRKVGGYEASFFLYRNDTDLALKILSAGYDVWFDPAWLVWHDSPAAARKNDRWLYMATRNWGWMARRHGRGLSKWLGMAAGFAWASRLAGLSMGRQLKVLKGAFESLKSPPPKLPDACRVDGKGFAALVKHQCARPGRAPSSRTAPKRIPT
jgi:GT2 family glycosyltransferase